MADDDRWFINAVLWIARAGAARADQHERLGNLDRQWRWFDRWAKAGRWDPILAALLDPDLGVLILNSTTVHAHPCAAGANKLGQVWARRSRPSAAARAGSGPRTTAATTG